MRIIDVDAASWKTCQDGRNVNALVDSGGINAVEPPYRIRIRGISNLPKQTHDEMEMLKEDPGRARAGFRRMHGRELEVYVESDPSSGS
jgi:hypothetical protein